jgi:hypothetical protein
MSDGQSANPFLVLKVCHDFEQFIRIKDLVRDKYFLLSRWIVSLIHPPTPSQMGCSDFFKRFIGLKDLSSENNSALLITCPLTDW